jgi:hypothetical protein
LNATLAALKYIKTNEDLWFRWMARPTVRDGYIDNYFVTRLTAAIPFDNVTLGNEWLAKYSESVKCLEDPSYSGCRYVRGVEITEINSLNQTIVYQNSSGIALSIAYKCLQKPNHYNGIARQKLLLAKHLLKNIFDVVIFDKMNDTCGSGALMHALQVPKNTMEKMLKLQVRPGFISKYRDILRISGTYEDLMPAAVVRIMRERNAEDYELYEYAQELMKERAVVENWDCSNFS